MQCWHHLAIPLPRCPLPGKDVFHAGTTHTTNRDATDKMHSVLARGAAVLARGPVQSGDVSLSESGVEAGE